MVGSPHYFETRKIMKIIAISDTHGLHRKLSMSPCDILIFAGDASISSFSKFTEFNDWLGTLSAKHILFVAGNHDTYLEKIGPAKSKKYFTNAVYLHNCSVNVMGKSFYGSPYSPMFNNWSFMYERGSIELKEIWEQIPENLDYLITHCPPYGILDRNLQNLRCGCEILVREIAKKFPLNSIFGHIHMNGGRVVNSGGISFYNVALLDEQYKMTNEPTIIETE